MSGDGVGKSKELKSFDHDNNILTATPGPTKDILYYGRRKEEAEMVQPKKKPQPKDLYITFEATLPILLIRTLDLYN